MGLAEQGSGGFAECDLICPSQGVLHTVNTVAPGNDGNGVFVRLTVEDRDLLLVDLLDQTMKANSHWGHGGGTCSIAITG